MPPFDSRRLTGPSLLLDRPGAALEVALPADSDEAVALWRDALGALLGPLGWEGETVAVRRFSGGASLAFTAPIDALYAATEVNEAAWTRPEARLAGAAPPPFEDVIERLAGEIARESDPALRALHAAAAEHGVTFLAGEDLVSVGSGHGVQTWPADALPSPTAVAWERIHDVPVLLVTGTNGKTTTVRLLAAIARAAGRTAGLTSTDRVEVAGEVVERGDFSGPSGARTLLRDPRLDLAILETARGGMLRRGLAVERAAAALVTNVAADHLGEYGVVDLEGLVEAKLVVTKAVGPTGRIVLNADDPRLAGRGTLPGAFRAPRPPIVWFTLDAGNPLVAAHLAVGGEAWLLDDGIVVRAEGSRRQPLLPVAEIPLAFGGAARYNVANALAAAALAAAAGLPEAAIAAGLRQLRPTPQGNPGRANLLERDGVQILLDYAHNAHGLAALLELAKSFPAERRLILLGHAGDRRDDDIRALARTAWTFRPDRVVVKELPAMLRGREPGEVSALIVDELRRLGAEGEAVVQAPDELAAVRSALAWARPGDLLVLLVHADRDAVLELLGIKS